MTLAKKEDADRDRFIEYLRLTEGIEYRTVGVNVPNRTGKKNFDYLLQSGTGETLALEITWLTDKDETHADKNEHHDFVRDSEKFKKLLQILESLISKEDLPRSIFIGVAYHVPFTIQQLNGFPADKLASAKTQLVTAIRGLTAEDSVSVQTDLGNFQISGRGDGHDLDFHSIGGFRGGVFDEDYFAAKIKNKIPHKNEQLDVQADRRILLFGNAISMTFDSEITRLAISQAITNFIQASPFDVTNIDEIYVDSGIDKLERIYPIVAA
jgi:hypothetical protein